MKRPRKTLRLSPALSLETNATILLADYSAMLLRQLTAARRDLAEDAVHDLRVATRRFRECLRVLRETMGGDRKKYKKPLRHARKLTRRMGALRNTDVFGAILREIQSEAGDRPEARAARRYRNALSRQRKKEALDASRNLRRFKSARFRKRVWDLLQIFGSHAPEPLSRETIRTVLSARFDEAFALKNPALDPENAEGQHRLRIALKRSRYGLEVLRFAFGEQAGDTLKKIHGFQDQLGDLHDLSVLLRNLEAWAASRKNKTSRGVEREEIEALKTHLQRQREELHRRFAEAFQPVQGERLLEDLMGDLQTEVVE